MHASVFEFLQLVALVFQARVGKINRIDILKPFPLAESQTSDTEKKSIANAVPFILFDNQTLLV
jgi:hypothetical protein